MSFFDYSETIQPGHIVLAWMTRSDVKPVVVTPDQVLNTRYGAFPHNNMIGLKYGSQIPSTSSQGFIHLLRPNPELWSLSLPHRTQIVYTPDASYVIQRLRIRPGSRVIESGTGSGSFTHALSRTVSATGRVFTFEFHQLRYEEARKEFKDHGVDNNITITHRDVCQNGFSIPEADPLLASQVFLDLPSPWLALPHLDKVIEKKYAVHICCFSPCMEQVIQTVEALKTLGYQRIEMVEVQAKKWEGRREMVKEVDEAVETLRDVKRRREEGLERKRADKERRAGQQQDSEALALENSATASPSPSPSLTVQSKYNPWGKGLRIKEGHSDFKWRNISKVETEIKSHTSYLTFAILPPSKEL
jgi:tRNA (adenine57-N1/adenine58-N1)-methyltransferase